ncbi:4'-phosphopantetheinyl transferase superfamily protein [Oscillospiraceae bacterium N12]|jgi:4'-phosphopantetheinyl transferase|uniref:4'-phosphopantetheinyl transferase superfamily protein n=1 Tax=Jilunia laotingensis TaxID=2763675 RepID=A0A926F4P8_9BACT|nr:4'-phosphopantetheinyl transferase superfamily protein [Jilunia laotingensis]MBC8593960.1 4'-phosphopantetheinyl transferase superfamily protein [Jilunia laotingensis]
MSVYLEHSGKSLKWGIWKMEETIEDLLSILPERAYYEKELQRFNAPHRKLEWLSVRCLLFHLLGSHKEVCYESNGKPYLADRSRFISISHTKGYVAVILSEVAGVGIDIEQYSKRVHKVAHKYMREDEPVNSYRGDDTWSLLLHWSAKEVMFKCMDASEVDFREHLRIEPFIPQERGVFLAYEYRTELKRYFEIHYLLHPDFVLTWQIDNVITKN